MKGCRGKRRWEDYDQATRALTAIWDNPHQQGKLPTNAYHCRWCDGYHLTTQTMPAIGPRSRIERGRPQRHRRR